MKKLSRRRHDVRSPNLLPMIDVLFVLLVFLVISANFSSAPRSVDVNLPSTSYGSLFIIKTIATPLNLLFLLHLMVCFQER